MDSEMEQRAHDDRPPESFRELFVDVAVLKSQMTDVRDAQREQGNSLKNLLRAVGGLGLTLIGAMAYFIITGRAG